MTAIECGDVWPIELEFEGGTPIIGVVHYRSALVLASVHD